MKQRGRKSAAELAVVPVAIEARRPPPRDFTEPQGKVWRDTVATMPADWFRPSHEPLLTAYCRHVARAAVLDKVAHKMMAPNDTTLEVADRALKMAERETRAIIACARSLRLTLQSQMHPRTAGRAAEAENADGPALWERRPKPWEDE